MSCYKILILSVLLTIVNGSYLSSISLIDGGYEGLVISVDETVPHDDCDVILKNLEVALADASSYLHDALDGRAYLRGVTVLFPSSWRDDCGRTVRTAAGEATSRADLRITPPHLLFPDAPWTQQSGGCGHPGDFISLSYTRLVKPQQRGELGRALVREWAKYRYGVFDEAGVPGDPVYPPCYHDEHDGDARVSGCSDVRLDTAGLCENGTQLLLAGDTDTLTPLLVHPEAKSSIMFAHTSPGVTKFCDASTHNRYAPTKHNAMCDRRSVSEVILQHEDFSNSIGEPTHTKPIDTTPAITYKRESLTRYVLVIEDTNDMLLRESWSFLRLAVRKFAVHDLSSGSELGVVTANTTGASRLQRLVAVTAATRDAVASTLPFTPGDGATSTYQNKQEGSSCLPCGLKEALDMLEERSSGGRFAAASVILVIAPGTGRLGELLAQSDRAKRMGTRIATINYPTFARPTHSALDALAHATGGPAFTVFERRENQVSSYLNTYFELTQALLTVRNEFYQGDRSKLPIEIHRRELVDDGRKRVTGSFVVGPELGEPSQFVVYLHNDATPLVRSVSLTSPSQHTYSARSDQLLSLKMLLLQAAINETGTWTYTIDRHFGSPQPNFVVVSATPRSPSQFDAPVTARVWTSSATQRLDAQSPPLAIYVEVKQGDWPVLGAKVEVKVSKASNESTPTFRDKFELLDTGSGDPDITKGDGVYTRYFTGHAAGGKGLYQFEVEVTDNGNTAYTWQSARDSLGRRRSINDEEDVPSQLTSINTASGRCCGSAIWPQAVRQLSPFQRVLPPLSVDVGAGAAERSLDLTPGHIADLRVQPPGMPGELRARLTWTAPGEHGDTGTVARYEVRYSEKLKIMIDDFQSARLWSGSAPFPLAAGAETTFSLDMSQAPELLDKPIFVAIRAYDSSDTPSRVSNVVRVLVSSPPRTPSPPDLALPERNGEFNPEPAVVPRLAAATGPGMILQVVLPVAAGAVVLAVCLGLYCVMVVHRRKRSAKEPPQSPNTSSMNPPPQQQTTPYSGPPPNYEAEEKKIYCTLPPQDVTPPPQQISIIGGRTLSPYQSWTASQLLHEHERRHSPYGYAPQYRESPDENMQGPPIPPPPNNNAVYGTNYRNTSFLSLADESSIYGQRHTPLSKVPPPTLPKPIMVPFNPSLQGSLSSVNSDKKKRNVTMV